MPRLIAAALFAAALAVPGLAAGQTAVAHIELGDRDHASRDALSALSHYEAALALDSLNYEAAWRAARAAVDLGEFQADAARRTELYARAEKYGRHAVLAMPREAEGHAQLARAIGRNALTKGTRDKIKYASEVYEQARAALTANPKHGGALHILGVWNAEIMRLNSVSRLLAKTLLGAKVFGEASWDNAERYLEESMTVEPARITHRLDLARVYVDRGERAKARAQYDWIVAAPAVDTNDGQYKREAAEALKLLK